MCRGWATEAKAFFKVPKLGAVKICPHLPFVSAWLPTEILIWPVRVDQKGLSPEFRAA